MLIIWRVCAFLCLLESIGDIVCLLLRVEKTNEIVLIGRFHLVIGDDSSSNILTAMCKTNVCLIKERIYTTRSVLFTKQHHECSFLSIRPNWFTEWVPSTFTKSVVKAIDEWHRYRQTYTIDFPFISSFFYRREYVFLIEHSRHSLFMIKKEPKAEKTLNIKNMIRFLLQHIIIYLKETNQV